MKKHIGFTLCAALLFCIFLAGCAGQPDAADNQLISVCLEQGRGFSAKSYIQNIQGTGDAVFQLQLQENYEIIDCSYEDYAISQSDNGFTVLTVRNVKYPCRITLSCAIPSTVIAYDPNGGNFAATGSTEPLRVAYGPSLHPRINTMSGAEKIQRDGFVMTGWNTSPDGSGQHIGLGSRVTTEKNETLQLYAQWERETSSDLFSWQDTEEGILLTAYHGADGEKLVIPEEIEGKSVTAIACGFAKGLSIGTLVVPDSVLCIEDGAFENCAIDHIYFFDTLQQVSDDAFRRSCPVYWHINAVMQPRYQAISDISAFADKMDLLLLHKNEKKLLLFSGCSMNYGVDSKLLEEAYPDYTVLNLGAVGGTNTQFQLECILPYIQEGDVFIHAPEQGSGYQLMSNLDVENRMFIAVEGNFDLLSMVDMTALERGAFDCFQSFNAKRRILEPCTYDDQYIPVNSHGDNDSNRIAANTQRFDEKYGLHTKYITEAGMDALAEFYDRIGEKGGRVYLSYAPINALCCSKADIESFSRTWEQGMLARGYETISSLNHYVMEAKYFYDTDYHLTTAGAVERTQQLIGDLAFLGDS